MEEQVVEERGRGEGARERKKQIEKGRED